MQIKTKIVSCLTADSKPVKQEVNGTVMLPPLVFPAFSHLPNLKCLLILAKFTYEHRIGLDCFKVLLEVQWNSTFFCIMLVYRGHQRKGVAIFSAT